MQQTKSFPLYAIVVVVLLGFVLATTIALGAGIVGSFLNPSEPTAQSAQMDSASPPAMG